MCMAGMPNSINPKGRPKMTEHDSPIVSVKDLRRAFKHKNALDGVTLDIPRGVVFGLVGENGAGKTTLVKHILGSYRAKEGSVLVFGRNPVEDHVEVLSRIGYLSEDRDLPGWMQVRQLIHYTQAFYPDWDEDYAEALRERFALEPKAKVKNLSRGEKAKLGLLVALAYRPELLLLDEPSSGLDPGARRHILEAIVRTVADEGRTVIFSSHLLDEVERVADKIAMIHAGKIILQGDLDDVKKQHCRFTVEFDQPKRGLSKVQGMLQCEGNDRDWTVICDGAVDQVRSELTNMGGRIVEEAIPSLEEIFLARVSRPTSVEMPL